MTISPDSSRRTRFSKWFETRVRAGGRGLGPFQDPWPVERINHMAEEEEGGEREREGGGGGEAEKWPATWVSAVCSRPIVEFSFGTWPFGVRPSSLRAIESARTRPPILLVSFLVPFIRAAARGQNMLAFPVRRSRVHMSRDNQSSTPFLSPPPLGSEVFMRGRGTKVLALRVYLYGKISFLWKIFNF